ncbi:hypothetical protein B9479_001926 [Cryptococcus floricola]|uniref:Uncharacterized protein n=1 Tax=Cryptococcus floricola TaxID=2591691 RepID=A0A5D3B517_9TREE|nr:hypothetical protein B9479_001926 [Cryptococcus floricola]
MCEYHQTTPDTEKQPLCASCASLSYPPTPTITPHTPPTPRRTLSRRHLYILLAALVLVTAALAGGAYAIHQHVSHRKQQDATTGISADSTASPSQTVSATSSVAGADASGYHDSGWNSGASSPNSGVWLAEVGEEGEEGEETKLERNVPG